MILGRCLEETPTQSSIIDVECDGCEFNFGSLYVVPVRLHIILCSDCFSVGFEAICLQVIARA